MTAATLFLIVLIEAHLLSRGRVGLVEELFLLDAGWTSKPWTIVTSGLAHDGLVHYGGNLVVLLMAGPFVDSRLGWSWWLGVFLGANALGGLTQIMMSPPGTTALGSSPGILALFVVAVVEVPPTWRVGDTSWDRRVWIVIATGSVLTLLIWLAVLTQAGEPGIGHWAHLVGAAVGLSISGIREWVPTASPQ